MSSTKFFRFPWATSGDKASIPETAQVDGSVSYLEGFGFDYELELGVNAAAKPVPRPESNQLYFDITENLRAWQLAGLPEWVTAAQNGGVAVAYPKSAIVRHDYTGAFLLYFAEVATDDEPGTSADWTTLATKEYVDSLLANALPIGSVFYTARNTAPTNSLKANGAAISRATYAALFAAIGTTFGAGDGTTTFNLPDLRGEFLRGLDDGRGVDPARALGSAQGSQNLAHTHQLGSQDSASYATPSYSQEMTYNYTGSPGPLVTTSSSGGSEARPRNVALLACIKY